MHFWLLPLVHLLAVMTPGPDFFLILEHSTLHSRRESLISAFGVACGCLIHMGTVIILVSLFETEVKWINRSLKILGTGYLFYLGISSLKGFLSKKLSTDSKKENKQVLNNKNFLINNPKGHKKIQNLKFKTYFFKGFLCNLLNPKAWAYFSSIFISITIDYSPSKILVLVIFFYAITQGWFSLMTILFTFPSIQLRLNKYRWMMSLLCGIAFCILGFSLIWN